MDEQIELDGTSLRSQALKMIERIQSGDTPIEDPDFRAKIAQLLRDEQTKQKLTEAIYARLRRLMIAAILDYMDMYPNEDIKLRSGKIKTIFKAELNRLNVTLRYSDSKGNKYPEVSTVVEVKRVHDGYDYSSITFLLSDGSELFAYRDYTKNEDYYTMYFTTLRDRFVVSQEKLFESDWHEVPNRRLLHISGPNMNLTSIQ